MSYNVDVPKSTTETTWTPLFEWYVVRCGSKNWHQNDLYLNETGMRAQNMLTILGSLINVIDGAYMTTLSPRESSLSS